MPLHPYNLIALKATPPLLLRIVKLIRAETYDKKVDPERFSCREAVAHLADYETEVLNRFQAALAFPGTQVPDWPEEQRAVSENYAVTDPIEQAKIFGERRAQTIAFLESVPEDKSGNTFVHPVRGALSIEVYAALVEGHDLNHIEHLSRYLEEKTAGTW